MLLQRTECAWSESAKNYFTSCHEDIPSASHSKITFSRKCRATDVQQRDRKSYIKTGGRCDDTSRAYGLFLYAPIRGQGFVVRNTLRVEDLVGKGELEGTALDARDMRSALPYGFMRDVQLLQASTYAVLPVGQIFICFRHRHRRRFGGYRRGIPANKECKEHLVRSQHHDGL